MGPVTDLADAPTHLQAMAKERFHRGWSEAIEVCTEAEVRIRQLNDRLEAVGMNLDMAAEEFELLDKVKAHYEVHVE